MSHTVKLQQKVTVKDREVTVSVSVYAVAVDAYS